MGMHNYRELKIWNRSMDFAVKVYEISSLFPMEEKYGLTSQLRRSVVSVPSNMSEGAGRGTNRQFKIFLEYAMGPINEAQTEIELAFRVKHLAKNDYNFLIDEALQIYKMILAFYNFLKEES
jgi:four helix bundle protein